MENVSRRVLAAAGLFVILASASAVLAAEGSFQKTLSVSGRVDLDVHTGAGDIRVRTGGAESVQVMGRIRARDDFRASADEKVRHWASNPPIEQIGNTVRIGRMDDPKYRNNVSIDYDIVTPADTRLTAGTGSGDLSVDGVGAAAEVSTGSGSIRMTGLGSDLRARTGSGDIELSGVKGSADLSTGSGNIIAGRVGGGLRARTGSGDVRADLAAPGDAEVTSGSGSIEVDGVLGAFVAKTGSGDIRAGGQVGGPWKVQSSSGDVTLRLGSDSVFDLAAHASSGRITVHHPITMTGVVSRKDVKGKVRGGGALLEVSTSSGDIRIE